MFPKFGDFAATRHGELISNLVDHVTAATHEPRRQEFGMIGALARKFFGSANDRRVKGYQARVDAINALEPEVAPLSGEALKARAAEATHQIPAGGPPAPAV